MKYGKDSSLVRAVGFGLLLLLVVACQRSTAMDSAPLPPSATPAPAGETPLALTITFTPDDHGPIQTAIPLPTGITREPSALDSFPISPLLNPILATPSVARSSEAYEQDVIKAVTIDLARRIAVPSDTLHLVTGAYLEAAVASPCGTWTVKEEAGPSPGGLVVGFEVLLEAEGIHHRYVAVGGLAHYCGLQ